MIRMKRKVACKINNSDSYSFRSTKEFTKYIANNVPKSDRRSNKFAYKIYIIVHLFLFVDQKKYFFS